MRIFFLALFLCTLSSAHRLRRRSEDVDPLLKELFSETNEPSPKDRRDEQSAGNNTTTSDVKTSLNKNDSALDTNSDKSKSDDSDKDTEDSKQPAVDSDDAPEASGPVKAVEDNVEEEQNSSKPITQDKEGETKLFSPDQESDQDEGTTDDIEKVAGDNDDVKDTTNVPNQSEEIQDKQEESTSNDKETIDDSSSNEKKNATTDEQGKKEDKEADSDGGKEDNGKEEKEEGSVMKDNGGVQENNDKEEKGEDTAVKDDDSGSEEDAKDDKKTSDGKDDKEGASVDTSELPSAEEHAQVPTEQVANIGNQNTNEDSQPGTTVGETDPGLENEAQPEPKSFAENVKQPSSDVNIRAKIPEAPTVVANQAMQWQAPVTAPVSVPPTQETNEDAEFAKKDTIPVAPRQPGASSSPLQLNKHSPGAELIKKFFIAKQEAKKKKEEEAKEKSLIGDGRYTVSSNNGYYNYASSPTPTQAPVNALRENGNEGICVDKYDSCPEFAKNHYCTDYKTLMKVQCRKSCKFCDIEDEEDQDDDDDEDVDEGSDTNDSDEDADDEDNDKDNDTKKAEKDKSDSSAKSSGSDDQKESDSNDDYAPKDSDDLDDDLDDDEPTDDDNEIDSDSEKEAKNTTKSTDDERDETFSDAAPLKNETDSNEDLPPTAEEFEQDDEDTEEKASDGDNAGDKDSTNDEDDDSDEIAKELSEQELFSNQNVKKDTIPAPPSPPSAYPKIDLKDVARYVTLYRSVAKKLFGEALDSAKKEFVAQQSKKSDIPVPIKEELRTSEDMSSSLEGFYSSQDNTKRDKIPMRPNNAEFTPKDETWANKAYEDAETYLRSKIPEFKNYAPPAMFNYPFYINDPNKTVETNEGENSKKSDIPTPTDPQEKYNKTLQDILKKDHIKKTSDPYEYLRNMVPGSSMKPIASKNGIKYIEDTYSRPIHLNTKSQWLDMVAKKKSRIPKPQPIAQVRTAVPKPSNSVPQIQTKPEAIAAQVSQYKSSEIPSINREYNDKQSEMQQQVSSTQDANFFESTASPSAQFESVESRSQVLKNEVTDLPPLFHGTTGKSPDNAKGFSYGHAQLPPLSHGGLPPLHHQELPPLHHQELPPLHHDNKLPRMESRNQGFATAQYTNQAGDKQVKANMLGNKEKGRMSLKEKTSPIQDMQIGIPNFVAQNSQKLLKNTQQLPSKSTKEELNAQSRQYPYPDDRTYPLPTPPEGMTSTGNTSPQQPQPQPMTQSPSGDVPSGSSQNYLQPNTDYVTDNTYTGDVLKKNLIRPEPDMRCDEGWQGATGDFGNFCYKIMYQREGWQKARDSCKAINGDLFSVKNAYEQRFLDHLATTPLWIGYQDKASDGTWSWSDGSTNVYTNWESSGQKDNQQTDCVILDAEEGKWRDVPCSEKHTFVCKKSGDCDVKNGWKVLTLSSLKGCYKEHETLQTWSDALETCNKDGGSLASILSDDEQTMISQVYSSDSLWIGYNDRENEGDWIWTDRTTSSYTNWDDASPNNGGVTCAVLTSPRGTWRDESCKSKHDFICKKSPKGSQEDTYDQFLSPPVSALLHDQSNGDATNLLTSIKGTLPAVPVHFWPLLKTTNGKTRGTEHVQPHGRVKQAKSVIELNGEDAWLDAGDFHDKCLSNPDLCIKGLSVAIQVSVDDSARLYEDNHYILDTSGDARGISVYISNNSLNYRVTTANKMWHLATDLMTNEWQSIVFTWRKKEGLTLYVNGAFKDNAREGISINPVEDKQTHLLVGKGKDDVFTKMFISSISVYPRVLTTENIPFVFSYDDTVLPSYRWLLSKLVSSSDRRTEIPNTKSISVNGYVKPVDGGLFINGDQGSYIDAGHFDHQCLSDPQICSSGFSYSCKLKFNKVVRSYADKRYILDSGASNDGTKGISAYIKNNNLYFDVAMSTKEDKLRWTVRAPLYTIRWQRVVLSWSLAKGLTLYMDGNFRSSTKLPKSAPAPVTDDAGRSQLTIGRTNDGGTSPSAEFAISSLAVYDIYLGEKDMDSLFSDKTMPYPGLIREVWRDISGAKISDLRSSPYYPNDPSDIQIIENFDSPFDLENNYGTKVKGYFVPPESGSYKFYLAGSRSAELWLSQSEKESGLKLIISFTNGSSHNEWGRSPDQHSDAINLEAGRYYYVIAVQKGTTQSDSLSAGVQLPSGRFLRPLTKETLQWRRKGNHYSGLIREVWTDMGGYQVSDLTENPNFPNNPSSIEVIDNFDAPFNVEDNYGSRVRGYFVAPETGHYRFYLAADSTGELWISSDENEGNLRKIVAITGWTDHNEWLKYAEQKSEKIEMKKGKSYYITVYQKAEKLGDCASVAVEMPNGHFEGPIKQKHLSWKLPDGSGPGPSSVLSALPKPVGLFPLDETSSTKDMLNDEKVLSNQVKVSEGPDGGKTAYMFTGDEKSFIEIPHTEKLDSRYSTTILASVLPTGQDGPIVHYFDTKTPGVHLWQFNGNQLFVRFVRRDGTFTEPLASRVLQPGKWNYIGASYNNITGVAQLWHDGKMVKSRNIGQIELRTQLPIRIGSQSEDKRRYRGKISCLQIYNEALSAEQIGTLRNCPVKGLNDKDGVGSSVASSLNQLQEEDTVDEIQGTDASTANQCRPNPCQNDGRCVIDLKRMDGYTCKCTLDFAGRNCQVSKPNANSPLIKKTMIPQPSSEVNLAENVKDYHSIDINNATELGDQKKNEDLYLLYQKVGCYNDNVNKHDLSSHSDIEKVTQEVCVRQCALMDQGFSYFGLQNGTKCFCGKQFGRYGKAEEESCDMRCSGNEEENCGGEMQNMVYFYGKGTNYTIRTYTGNNEGADTKANVYITLFGDKGDSGFRRLSPTTREYSKGSVDTEVMVLPELGDIRKLRVLHDNTGKNPSWFLDKMIVEDENGKSYEFVCNQWLSETQGGGRTERLLTLRKRKRSHW